MVKGRRDVDGTRGEVWAAPWRRALVAVASRQSELKAAVSQCPFTDGLASALALGPDGVPERVAVPSPRIFASMVFRRPPAMVPHSPAPRVRWP